MRPTTSAYANHRQVPARAACLPSALAAMPVVWHHPAFDAKTGVPRRLGEPSP